MIALPKQIEKTARYSFDAAEHVHRLDGKPLMGTSTVVQVIAKYLEWWVSGQALTPLGWLNIRTSKIAERIEAADKALLKITDMTRREYADYLQTCYRAHNTRKETAAVTGTDMHAELERYVKASIYENAGAPIQNGHMVEQSPEVYRFASWATEHVSEFLWSEGHCYSERLWTGGICDCGALLQSNKISVIDFKSSREAYFSQLVQTGGYAKQMEENGIFDANGAHVETGFDNIKIDVLMVFPFGGRLLSDGTVGEYATEPHARYDVAKWQAAFEAAVTLHKLREIFEQ